MFLPETALRSPTRTWWTTIVASRTVGATVVGALLVLSWLGSYLAGGSSTAAPHAFYLPILGAAALFGVAGGTICGLLAALLAGPLLPLDVALGTGQLPPNWLLRGLFFVVVGGAVGFVIDGLRRSYETALEERFEQELRLAAVPARPTAFHDVQIRDLLEQRRFTTVFQPIYALDDGRLTAVEALTRFDTDPPESPLHWFQLAHELGLGRELEIAAIEVALRTAERDALPSGVVLNLNCSPATLADPRLTRLVEAATYEVVLEITEHAVVEDYGALEQAMATLRGVGAHFAVDDAGAGFASLRHIVRLAPEYIKLDMSLTQNLRHDPIRATLADCLLRFARDTGSHLVVEGIEHPADLVQWRAMGALAGQGFHLGRPTALPVASRCPAIVAVADQPVRAN